MALPAPPAAGTQVALAVEAFSPDGGRTWETNYVMEHMRL